MDIAAYLARIGYSGDTAPSVDALRELHRAHMLAVPFENLDIERRKPISIDAEDAVRKIVSEQRGGFCYELNGAFAALLQAMGFDVTLLSARVPRPDGSLSPEFDHLTLAVHFEHRWIADVGFGDSFLDPLILHPFLEQDQDGQRFRIIPHNPDSDEPGRMLIERFESDGGWKPHYTFTRVGRRLQDFAAMCRFHQESPESHFTQNSICSVVTPEGRITLKGMTFIETKNGKREERTLASVAEREQILRERFGIRL